MGGNREDLPDDLTDEPRSFGRRHGKTLRKGRKALLEELLPKIKVDIKGDLDTLFGGKVPDDVWLEVGFGGGEHLAGQALAHPDVGFIGAEPFINGVAGLLKYIDAEDIQNVRVYDDDIRLVFPLIPDGRLSRVYVLFPDPWRKARHFRRRFISQLNLDHLARMMKPGAELRVASDHIGYVRWTIEQLLRHPSFEWTAQTPDDWRVPPEDWIQTRYEQKALEQGDFCTYLRFVRV